ncbi:MAG: TonB-dependent receptor domain-containing protein [Thermoanaerobaculia bacterium]
MRPKALAQTARIAALVVALLAVALVPAAAGARVERFRGLSLTEALARLDAETSIKIVFSESLVRPEMLVTDEPSGALPEAILRELLAPHGLTLRPGPGGYFIIIRTTPGARSRIRGLVRHGTSAAPVAGARIRIVGADERTVSREDGSFEFQDLPPGFYDLEASLAGFRSDRVNGVAVVEGGTAEVTLDLPIVAFEEIVITPSLISVSRGEPAVPLRLDADVVRRLPVAGEDVVRSVSLLPGAASNDFSAEFNLRGGRADEVLVLLDGLELFEPYHLRDFESALSVVPSESVERLELRSGGFPAAYGDRMSGVLEMTSVDATPGVGGYLKIGLLDLEGGTANRFLDGRGQWLLAGRWGTLEEVSTLAKLDERPRFWDGFAKVGLEIAPRHSLSFRWLDASDELALKQESPRQSENTRTAYSSSYRWLRHVAEIGDGTLLESQVFSGRLHQNRKGTAVAPFLSFDVADRRVLDIRGIQHTGTWRRGPGLRLQWGGMWRDLDSRYDYVGESTAPFEDGQIDSRIVSNQFSGRQFALFLSSRWRPWEQLTLEVGMRFDENELAEESHTSPRLNLAWAITGARVLRLAWGRFVQSQRAYELQVEDGITTFSPDERSTQAVVAYEHILPKGLHLRLEGYDRSIANPRPRFENVIDPVSRFPEVQPDRVRIAPEQSRSRGLELFLRRDKDRLNWWASYAYSSIEDSLDGAWVKRSIDQPHAALASVTYLVGPAWSLGLTGRYHTGWPTTPLTLEIEDAPPRRYVPDLGSLYSGRFDSYLRFDTRVARSWRTNGHPVSLTIDVFNLANRTNLRGFAILTAPEPGSKSPPALIPKRWIGRVAIARISWRF